MWVDRDQAPQYNHFGPGAYAPSLARCRPSSASRILYAVVLGRPNSKVDHMHTPDNCQDKHHNYYDPLFCANMHVCSCTDFEDGGTMTKRAERLSETIENYLESVYNMQDEGKKVIAARLAERLGVKPPTVSQTLQRMVRDGLIKIDDANEIQFTKNGREVAEAAIRRHRLIERFMTDFLGIGWAVAHTEAERLQHAMSDLMEEKMFEALGNPNACPHGNPIPGMQPTRLPSDAITLDDATEGQRVTILRITEEGERDPRLLDYLQKNNLIPHTEVLIGEVAPWSGVITLRQGKKSISLGLKAARTIWVQPV